MQDLAGRVAKLERDNRRLKLGGLALAAVLVAVPLVGAVLPQEVPDVIDARQFRVLDSQGQMRAAMIESGVSVLDAQGEVRAAMGDPGVVVFDEQGQVVAQLPAAWE